MVKSSPVLCGSISGSIGGLGVIMHNAAYKALNLDYTYVSFQPKSLENAINSMRTLGIKGLGVTMPFKVAALDYLDELDESARMIGAVNTIVNNDGRLKGYNTDYSGAIKSLEEVTNLKDLKISILGAGGASRAIVYGLKKYTDNITIYNNTEGKGEDLAARFGVAYGGPPSSFNRNVDYDILINATSVGFKSEETVLSASQMKENKIVLDAVFIPLETNFLRTAKSLGCQTIPGYRMLIHQACFQFELYTGEKAPFDIMEKALFHKINTNIT